LERLADSAMRGVDYSNPESMKKWMRKVAKEFSSELGSDVDSDELVEELSKGEGLDQDGESEEFGESS
jgi:hypothetical protein